MISRRALLRISAAFSALLALVTAPTKGQPGRGPSAEPTLSFDPFHVLAEEDGLRIGRQDWSLGRERGVAWRVSVPRDAAVSVLTSARVEPFGSLLPSDPGPWAAINGGFYDRDGQAMGAVIAGGVVHAPYRRGGGSGVVQVTGNGVEIVHHSNFQPDAMEALQSIDRIVARSKPLVNVRPAAPVSARSAIALTAEEIVLVLVASERSIAGNGDDVTLGLVSGYGMSLWAFSRYLVTALGAESALNLDGGVSAQLAARIDGRKYRVRALRGTVNAVLLRPRTTNVDGRQ